MLRQRLGHLSVDDPPLLDQLRGGSDTGVDEDGPGPRVLDHESVDRDVIQRPDAREVEPDDLHQGMKGDTAKTANSRAT